MTISLAAMLPVCLALTASVAKMLPVCLALTASIAKMLPVCLALTASVANTQSACLRLLPAVHPVALAVGARVPERNIVGIVYREVAVRCMTSTANGSVREASADERQPHAVDLMKQYLVASERYVCAR